MAQPVPPRGRKRALWQAEMSRAFEDAGKQMGELSTGAIAKAVGTRRRLRKALPEVTVVAHRALKAA